MPGVALVNTDSAITSGRVALYYWACAMTHLGTITSKEIAATSGVNETQVRRDLGRLYGRAGKRGVGYKTETLGRLLRKTLGENVEVVRAAADLARSRYGQLGAVRDWLDK